MNAQCLFNSDHKENDGLDIENFSILLLNALCSMAIESVSLIIMIFIRYYIFPKRHNFFSIIVYCVHHSTFSKRFEWKNFPFALISKTSFEILEIINFFSIICCIFLHFGQKYSESNSHIK